MDVRDRVPMKMLVGRAVGDGHLQSTAKAWACDQRGRDAVGNERQRKFFMNFRERDGQRATARCESSADTRILGGI
eukprot:SAG31_NODE_6274_length_2093_cov_2.302407_3_plen_76_part_00